MHYLIGVDEAGYGPNLGPLVISSAVFKVDGTPCEDDLYQRLSEAVCDKPCDEPAGGVRRLAIADSKQLYSPQRGIALLERGLLCALSLLGCRVQRWRDVWHALAAADAEQWEALPWHARYDPPLPSTVDGDDLAQITARWRQAAAAAGVELVALRSRAVFPARFNRLTEQCGTKATALSETTVDLLGNMIESINDGPIMAVCDKHGGRNRYHPLLQSRHPDTLIEIRRESRAESIYRWGPARKRVEVRFRCHGEEFLPTALSSMCSKYLRELAMDAFNQFWCAHVPGLRPTAGYPVDARRFKADIAAAQRELDIDDSILWRCR